MFENIKTSSHLFGSNAAFIEELYQQYNSDPTSVDPEWHEYFKGLNDSSADIAKSTGGTSWKPSGNKIIGVGKTSAAGTKPAEGAQSPSSNNLADVSLSINAVRLINAYRTYGHYEVKLDPLNLAQNLYHPELDYKNYGFGENDLDTQINLGGFLGFDILTLKDLINYLRSTYAATIGAEFMHIESADERTWLQAKLENSNITAISQTEKLAALNSVIEAEMFESYLHAKFPGTKRFSVEGLENSIVAIDAVVLESVNAGVNEIVLGMAHRGRLNTLTKVMRKSYCAMFSEFKGEMAFPADLGIPGDVKYHLGASSDTIINGQKVHMTLTPNPSHLEVVNSVVLGKVRAKQDLKDDASRAQVLGVLIHGDAAFSGQGSVMEALSLSQLTGYHTGGTVHIVANNQIGFTTNPTDSRSTDYCTDIAKFIGAPIFHVNGDDAQSVVCVAKLAAQYRATFKKDVVIDIVGYRKYGHNEGDEPLFTQPIMYSIIKDKKNPAEVYSERLIAEGVIDAQTIDDIKSKFKAKLDHEFELSKDYKVDKADWLEGNWSKLTQADVTRPEVVTGVELTKLQQIGHAICQIPQGFNVNPKVARLLDAKSQMFKSGKSLDWAAGESLAFATLLGDGYPIRMTGQDVERGTFSHRHAVITDQNNESKYIPVNNLKAEQKAQLEIKNSNLSEFAVLGFEYGYSFTHPHALTIWEAQFGDFANGAQVVIDQYVSSGEAKWLRMNGLVMLLPHGYEGQGPEHSSARLERFLQLCAKDNIQVVNPTTPASLFHVLRRQMLCNFRKPLIVMSPKSLLRHKLAVSDLSEFADQQKFQPIIGETAVIDSKKVKRVVLCSGKIYYDLFERRQELKAYDVALIRLEQIYPFAKEVLASELKKYPSAEIVWCQEEHRNMGAYHFVEPRINKVLGDINHQCKNLVYIGRDSSASPAVGYMKLHVVESAKLLQDVFGK